MPRLSNKHFNAEIVSFANFSGGLNLALPPEAIGDNEMQEATNLEFAPDSGLLRVRGGLSSVYTFPNPVRDIIPISGDNACLVRNGDDMHKLADGVATKVGTVDGNGPASFEFWGEAESVIMTFGAHLHLFDGTKVTQVEGEKAPDAATNLFYRDGRIVVTETDSDVVRFSGVGDPARWKPGTESDALEVEVGYKDGCRMSAIASLAGEMLVFKRPSGQPEHGRIYRLQGTPGDWTVIPHSRGSAAWNSQSVANVANDLLFLTREGMANMSTVAAYGDFRQEWAGAKINPKLSQLLTDNCRLWHIPLKGQVWTWDGQSDEVWCYHYQVGGGAWTKLSFPGTVGAVASVRGQTYLGIGNTVYVMGSMSANDVLRVQTDDGYEETEVDIVATWKPKTILRRNQILLKGLIVNYQSSITAHAIAKVDEFRLVLPLSGYGDIAYLDDDIACLDDDPLVTDFSSVARTRCNIRRWDITPEIVVTNGEFSMSSVNLEIAEV